VNMKNFFLFVLAVFFVGCANSTPNISVKTSDPIFFTLNESNRSVYVNFKNSATGQDVNAEILSEFAKAGFRNEPNIKNADFIILGDVQSFSRIIKRDPRFSMGMGYGFGRPSFGFGYSMFFPFGYYDDDDFSTNSYTYHMQVSVLVRPKNGGEKATNISLMQAGNVYSPSYIWPFFKERLAKQIVSFFYNVSQK
jgi:putative lipoprotein